MTPGPAWTRPEDVEAFVLKQWLNGRILAAHVADETIFPLRMRVRGPDGPALAARFGEAQAWVRALEAASRSEHGFDLVWREVQSRQSGRNRLPSEIMVPNEADALRLIRKQADADRFDLLTRATTAAFTDLLPWLARKPLLALEHAADWPRILAVLTWFRENPRSGLYLRQADIPLVDTKFIERRRGLISELLDLISPHCSAVGPTPSAALTFEARYGLREKPATIRFRLLGGQSWFAGLSDVRTPAEEFARLDLRPETVFIMENEVNGLAFPPVKGAIVLFGLGNSLSLVAGAEWLKRSRLVYWGDIDTHGFAMLARLRTYFPEAQSLLMDEATLLAYRPLWVREEQPFAGNVAGLTDSEHRLFDDLRLNRYGDFVRLEQERIPYRRLEMALGDLLL